VGSGGLPRAAVNSRVRLSTCFWRSAADTFTVGALPALGLLVRCPLGGCPRPPRRCMSLPYGGFTTILNPTQISIVALRHDVRFGSILLKNDFAALNAQH